VARLMKQLGLQGAVPWKGYKNNFQRHLGACLDLSETSRPLKLKKITMRSVTRSIWSRKVKQMGSGKSGAVQFPPIGFYRM